jgi:ribosomal protein S18 acetylase RimI-like enzyme
LLETSELTLREQTDDDTDFLFKLYIGIREAELLDIGWAPAEIQSFLEQQFAAQAHSYRQRYPEAGFQIVEYRGEPVGRLYLHRGANEYRIIDIALLAEFRNRKLGRHLIQTVQDLAAASSIPVGLHVEHLNPAVRLYQRLGFETMEDQGIHLYMQWDPYRRIATDQ